ncbi:MAG: protein kinase [Byssovorax sp.]
MPEPKHAGEVVGASRAERGSASTPPPARDPKIFGKYRLIAAIGHGGMAEVFLAVMTGPAGFNKLQVVKRLRPALAEEPDLCAMFLDEARLAARLNHRNIVQTNEVGVAAGDQYFIAMEYLDGQPYNRILSRARQQKRAVPLGISLRILVDLLSGLHYAHELADYDGAPLHIVHRDISPQNVFVTYDGQTKIVDFGIAKAARRMVETEAGVIKGKVSYMAPEQAFAASSEVDRRADLFSVGVLLWEAVSGKRLWQGLSDPEIIGRLLHAVPALASEAPDAPPELCRICDRALSLSPSERYATAAEMRAELEAFMAAKGLGDSPEQLGAFVAELFEEQRAELRALVDSQLARLRDSIPPEAAGVAPRLSQLPELLPPALDEEPLPAGDTPPRTPSVSPARGTLRGAVLVPTESTAPSASSRVPMIVMAIALSGALGAVGFLLRTRPAEPAVPAAPSAAQPPPSAPPAESASPATSAQTKADEGAYVRARISVNPADARILLDGAALPGNPFEGKLIKDGAVHRVQFEAGGFQSQSRIVVFDKDVSLDVALLPKAKSGDAPASTLGVKPDPYGGH